MNNSYLHVIEFIKSLYPNQNPVPLHAPVFLGNERKYLADCVDSTFVSSVGQYVDKFEFLIAEYTQSKKAVACVNGTSALHLALKLVGVKRDTEVITQPLTFIATANAISYCGAQPIFLDVDMETLGLSPVALKRWLEKSTSQKYVNATNATQCFNNETGRQIAAVVPMHTFGFPCKIDEIVSICKEHHIPVVEDAAESIGSFYKGKHTGTFGNVGIISFNGNKTITTGGGGILLFNSESMASHAKHLTTQAKVPHAWEFVHDEIGYNYRMPNINAAIGCAQLEKLDEILISKRNVGEKYQKYFTDIEGIEFFTQPESSIANYWLNTVFLKNRSQRDRILEEANNNGVMIRPSWRLMTDLTMFEKCKRDELLNAKNLSSRLVNLPSSARLNAGEIG